MRWRTWGVLGLVLVVASVAAGASAASDEDDGNEARVPQRWTIAVDEMPCSFCTFGLEKKLKEIDGVGTVEVERRQARATLSVPEGTLSPQRVVDAVRDAGFTLEKLEVRSAGRVRGMGDSLSFALSHGIRLPLAGGPGYETLHAIVRKGQRELVVRGEVRRAPAEGLADGGTKAWSPDEEPARAPIGETEAKRSRYVLRVLEARKRQTDDDEPTRR